MNLSSEFIGRPVHDGAEGGLDTETQTAKGLRVGRAHNVTAPALRGGFVLDEFLPYRLLCAHKAVHRLMEATYESRFGLSDLQWRVVAALSWGEPRMQRDLCAMTGGDKVAVNRAVQVLDSRGLVQRHYSEADRRSHLLTLTPKGEVLSDQIGTCALSLSEALSSCNMGPERESLGQELRKLEAWATELAAAQPDHAAVPDQDA